jgi:hypothetical protein
MIKWVKREVLMSEAAKFLHNSNIVLDIGSGIRPQEFIIPKNHICAEPYEEYSEILIKKKNEIEKDGRNLFVLKMTWHEVAKHFTPKSVDTIFLIDVIEHIEKDEATELLVKSLNIASKQIAIFTPWGFMPQEHPDGIDYWGLKGGDWQRHKSGWLPSDFEGEDWDFIACEDFHPMDGYGKIYEKPYGAFWAIKTFKKDERRKSISIRINQQIFLIKLIIKNKIKNVLGIKKF